MRRKTKIVATIGPASRDDQTIRALIEAGVNVARLNFSHGTFDEHAETIERLRRTGAQLGQMVMILQDLQGPKIRTGKLPQGQITLQAGSPLKLSVIEGAETGAACVHVDMPELPKVVQPGSRILLSDGQLELVVQACKEDCVETTVVQGGTLKSHQGINLPGVPLDIPGFTEKDMEDLVFGLEHGVDMVAISFVRTAKDVIRVREAIADRSPHREHTPVIAKLERPEALENLAAIVDAADGVMVARGDLGVEMSPEEVPIAQKKIIEEANRRAKIVITATQMLESMIQNPRPSRAEASDIANAIFDGTDAVMLSGETAVGKYPVRTVNMMDAIVRQAEANLKRWGHWRGLLTEENEHNDALFVVRAAAELAHDRHVAAIAVFTKSGSTARLMSKARPDVPILGFTPHERTCRRMGIYWGVVPLLVPEVNTMERLIGQVEAGLLGETPVRPGQQVVLICGFPVDRMRPSNLVMLHQVEQRH